MSAFALGCNWSEALEGLLREELVAVDYIKTGAYGDFEARFARMRALRPVLLHGLDHNAYAGMAHLERIDFALANRLLARCASPHYGLHLSIEKGDLPDGTEDARIHARISAGIRAFQAGLHVPLLVENVPDSPTDRTTFRHYPYAEAEKIARLVEENGVGLLLDLTHAKITARYRHWDIFDYCRALPLDRVREVHVNGSGRDANGDPLDTHQAMEKEDYALLDWLLGRANPAVVTLEYDGYGDEGPQTVRKNLLRQLRALAG